MPMIAKCDICGCNVTMNAAKEGLYSTRGKLTVRVEVVRSNGSPTPIICARCMRLAAAYGETSELATVETP